jgi:DNA invertase Pin-like site-specific DNA recombinase
MTAVVTYCRVSSEEQAEKDISIPAQRKALQRWVAEQPGLPLVAEFTDEGVSAYAPADKRPGFCDMVSYCRKHDVQLILVHKLDRFSRNREESILFKSLLRKHGVTIKSITENFDPETPQGFLYEGMIEVINQFYSMNLATETMKGMRKNAERGWHNGGRTPYGYVLERVDENGRERGRLVPGPPEHVAVVREMFDLAVQQGYGLKRVANLLNTRGVPAPRRKHWNASTIGNILDNPVYAGDIVWLKSKKAGRTGRTRTDEGEQIVHQDAHEAIIDRETFEKRRALAASRQFDVHTSPRKSVDYLLSRLIRCEHCGNNFIGRRHTYQAHNGEEVTQLSHYCSGYLCKGRSVCPSLPVDAAWVESFVLDIVQARLCEAEAWAELERAAARPHRGPPQEVRPGAEGGRGPAGRDRPQDRELLPGDRRGARPGGVPGAHRRAEGAARGSRGRGRRPAAGGLLHDRAGAEPGGARPLPHRVPGRLREAALRPAPRGGAPLHRRDRGPRPPRAAGPLQGALRQPGRRAPVRRGGGQGPERAKARRGGGPSRVS